ncbi:MAG: hypothetical protein LBR28_01420, partial [Bacteroidales bacterium]|nr:hypothetical protein [Bacteroidales bacterium]
MKRFEAFNKTRISGNQIHIPHTSEVMWQTAVCMRKSEFYFRNLKNYKHTKITAVKNIFPNHKISVFVSKIKKIVRATFVANAAIRSHSTQTKINFSTSIFKDLKTIFEGLKKLFPKY